MRCVVLGLLVVSCTHTMRLPEQHWESAPPPPAPAAPAMPVAQPVAAKPSPYEPCPGDLSIAVTRTIDGRMPAETIKARYAKQHQQLVRRDELIRPADAVTKIIALETEQPGVVPAGFRDQMIKRGRDPWFRLHMARCELAEPTTLRRAGYDAALAFLLGARVADMLPIVQTSMFPDGSLSRSCRGGCGNDTCDAVTQQCVSKRARSAAYLSAAELEIEDTLVRAFGTHMTTGRLESDRYDPNDLVSMWLFGRYTKCDGALCNVTRFDIKGKTRLVHWDRRYRGETVTREPEPWEICYAETNSVTRGGCTAHCDGAPGSKERATCVATCTTLCPITAPNSPGSDDD